MADTRVIGKGLKCNAGYILSRVRRQAEIVVVDDPNAEL